MRRPRVLALPLIALTASALALTGCSSDSKDSGKDKDGSSASVSDGDDQASGGGKGSAHLTYSGGDSGEFTIKSVGCAVMDGKLTAITAPDSADSSAPAKPSFTAVISDDKAMTTLTTEGGDSYLHTAAPGITGSKSGGTWVVTVAGLELGPTDPTGDSITVEGSITCGSVAGM